MIVRFIKNDLWLEPEPDEDLYDVLWVEIALLTSGMVPRVRRKGQEEGE